MIYHAIMIFSVGGLINRDFKMNVEMKYSSSRIDKIRNYFDKQQFQMIDFVYKFKQKNGKESSITTS